MKAIDIDTQKDWDLAEALFRGKNYRKLKLFKK